MQWITLFDDQDDDEFDGDLGEDDEELPMVKTYFNLTAMDPPIDNTPSPQKANPPVSQPVEEPKPRETGIKKPTPAAPSLNTQSSAGNLRPNPVNQNLMSPIGNVKKRKTMVDPSGNKHVVTDDNK